MRVQLLPVSTPMKLKPKQLSVPSTSAAFKRHISAGRRALFTASTLVTTGVVPPPTPPPLQQAHARPHAVSTTRLPSSESQHHSQNTTVQVLALAPSPASSSSTDSMALNASGFGHNLTLGQSVPSALSAYQSNRKCATNDPSSQSQLPKLYLDVGACGIPKCGRRPISSASQTVVDPSSSAGVTRSIQVGEDAYFIRGDSMGVADGVGGWSRTVVPLTPDPSPSPDSFSSLIGHRSKLQVSPSALFALRLMHFCAEEVEMASNRAKARADARREAESLTRIKLEKLPAAPSSVTGQPLFSDYDYAKGGPGPRNARPFIFPWESSENDSGERFWLDLLGVPRLPESDIEDDVQIELDTIGPVDILERAYEKTLKLHVTPPSERDLSQWPPGTGPELQNPPQPLLAGSSTALLAVLNPNNRLNVAHVGDCIALLVRDGAVVWRTEEMWCSFNHPLQLGPSSRTKPSSARLYDVEVREGDILILASDGMSDNLWEEDVLDEVGRFLARKEGESRRASDTTWEKGKGRSLAAMISEALCSRARDVSTKPAVPGRGRRVIRGTPYEDESEDESDVDDEIPFARRAREEGKLFYGGKRDDISVLVAVISATPTPS